MSRAEDKYCKYCGEVLDYGAEIDMCEICFSKSKKYDEDLRKQMEVDVNDISEELERLRQKIKDGAV